MTESLSHPIEATPETSASADLPEPQNTGPKQIEPPGPSPDEPDQTDIAFGLSSGDRRFLLAACSVICLLAVVHLVRLNWPGQASLRIVRPEPLTFRIDVNRANWVEWMQLPEIGETMARNIVADREQNGPFASIADVQRVRGIGAATMQKIRPHLQLAEPAAAPPQ